MKILYLANGTSIHTKRWLRWFIQRGHKVFLITPRISNIEGIEGEYIFPFYQKGGLIPRPTYILKVRQIIERINPDVVHGHSVFCYGMYGALTNFHPFVMTGWGNDIIEAPYRSFYHKYLAKFVLRKADFITVFSKHLYDHIQKLGVEPQNLEIIVPWKADIYERDHTENIKELRNEIGIPPHSFIVVSPRNVRPIYKIVNIVYSIPYVIKKHPNTIFVFLKGQADENYFKKVLSTFEKLSIKRNVRIITRWLSDKEMAALYKISNVIVSIVKIDQFAVTIREAMVCGSIPIIGKLEIYRTLFGDENAFFVSGEGSKEIADKIINLIENPKKMNRIIERNKAFIKEHEAMEKKLEEMEQIYFQLLKN